ncbi:MAG: SDR family NAD(P)-dependent oxidoreductase [Saccharospirillaceae bacterium]|nr:SDR family NAD(P)-dependent oxidoreductase [Pseudomonadales bacterium]NRB77088.1 SDR family NAD(P)-dependent oxidoreductase [Saccharospirillaceae bacterium]
MKTALITGGTSGIGLSIVHALLLQNYRVYFIGRNAKKGTNVEKELHKLYPNNAHFIELDLSNISQVKTFAKQFLKDNKSLDLLANVAGVMEREQTLTDEGFEKTFAVGYLSAVVLSTELLPLLEKSQQARIVNVAGVQSFIFKARLDFNDLTFSKNYSSFKTAITTVHAKTVFTQILADKLKDKSIDVNAFHPGAVRSDLMFNMPWWAKLMSTLLSPVMSKTSKTGIYVCSNNDIQGVTGKYFKNKKQVTINFDVDYKKQLWLHTEVLLKNVN